MTMTKECRWKCSECGEIINEYDLLIASNPFSHGEVLCGCPACHAIEGTTSIDQVCDEPGCELLATCGLPTEGGYRRTCSLHANHNP